ncbi:MAG: GntR family transcriptional regulator [Pirellulales bacterium]|nr:GntR family transcriptional regulator [Pirellulales bacterium]
MYLYLNHRSGEPIYRQIVEAIKYKIASGQIAVDERLPSIRRLAEELKINPRTMLKAYEELQHAGLVVMRQGQGVFVANHGTTTESVRRKAIGEMARRMLAEAFRLGAGTEEVLKIIHTESSKMEQEQGEAGHE